MPTMTIVTVTLTLALTLGPATGKGAHCGEVEEAAALSLLSGNERPNLPKQFKCQNYKQP